MELKFIALFLLLLLCCDKKGDRPLDKPVVLARVNGENITISDFQKKYNHMKSTYDPVSLKISMNTTKLKRYLLNQMITKAILRKEASKLGVIITEEELEPFLDKLKKDYAPKELRKRFLSGKISYKDWKEEQRDFLLIEKLTKKIVSSAPEITISEIRDYYKKNSSSFKKNEQVRIRQIVVFSESAAGEVLSKIRRGDSFEKLAMEYSISPDKENGGDIGWFEKGKKIPEFDIAFKLEKGRVSKIIKSPYGYHILKVIGKKKALTLSFAEVKDKIREIIARERDDEIYNTWLENKIADAEIFRNNEILNMIR